MKINAWPICVFCFVSSAMGASQGWSQASSTPASPGALIAPAGTQIELELTETVSTRTHGIGAKFSIRLAAPVIVNGQELIAPGVVGEGEVVDSGKGGMGGKPGKLVLAARFLMVNGVRTPVRGLRMSGSGVDRSGTSTGIAAIPYIGLASLLVSGGDVVITSGGRASARLAQDFPAPAQAQPNVQPAAQ
jgi:hypothetical protein